MIVPDSSVLVPALIDEGSEGAYAREVFEADGDLHAPHLLDVEVLSVLRRLVLRGEISARRAEQAIADLDDLTITRYPHLGLAARVWGLRENVGACHATYVALAEALDATLVTADKRLAGAPGIRCAVRVLGP